MPDSVQHDESFRTRFEHGKDLEKLQAYSSQEKTDAGRGPPTTPTGDRSRWTTGAQQR